MSLILWSRPYAAYGQKAPVALYELGLPFEPKLVEGANEAVMAGFRALSPFAKMPTLVDAATFTSPASSSSISTGWPAADG